MSEDVLPNSALPSKLEVRWRALPSQLQEALQDANCTAYDTECLGHLVAELPSLLPYYTSGVGDMSQG